jgi:hypothetical protein
LGPEIIIKCGFFIDAAFSLFVSGDYTRLFYKVKNYWQKLSRSGFTRLSDGKLPLNLISKSGMTDHLETARRSWNMSRIRGKDTKPEMAVRKMLHAGFLFRLHVKDLPGRPLPSVGARCRIAAECVLIRFDYAMVWSGLWRGESNRRILQAALPGLTGRAAFLISE